MAKMAKCPKCGTVFKRPKFGYKPLEYKAGLKIDGGFVSLGAIFNCPECNYEGSAKDFETVSQELNSFPTFYQKLNEYNLEMRETLHLKGVFSPAFVVLN